MQKTPDNIDLILPFGEALRGFLEQPFMSAANLKATLRARGIFMSSAEKRDAIPLLTCCLLSPIEFDQLRECQIFHEDNPKTITRTLPWNSRKTLMGAIPDDLDLPKIIGCDVTHYKVIGSPQFVPIGGNRDNVSCEFQIEREDFSKCWAATKTTFRGKLRIERNAAGNAIKFLLTHTAAETKDVNREFVKHLTHHFKKNGDVDRNAEAETILFSSFDNERRIAFFRSLTKDATLKDFEFSGTTHFGARPDPSHQLPPDVKWMEDKVEGLKVNGVALQDIFFLKNAVYHKFFLFYSIEAKFRFDCLDASGTCTIVFEFPDFMPTMSGNAEFEVNISTLALAGDSGKGNKTALKEELLRRINEFKLLQFEKFKTRPTSAPTSQLEAALDWSPA